MKQFSGQILDSITQLPAAGIDVMVTDENGTVLNNQSTITNGSGQFGVNYEPGTGAYLLAGEISPYYQGQYFDLDTLETDPEGNGYGIIYLDQVLLEDQEVSVTNPKATKKTVASTPAAQSKSTLTKWIIGGVLTAIAIFIIIKLTKIVK